MREFSGLCIGGPRAGQMVAHHAPLLRVPRLKPLRVEMAALAAGELCEIETFDYRHEYLRDYTKDEIGFWVPDCWTLIAALKELSEFYSLSRHVSKGAA